MAAIVAGTAALLVGAIDIAITWDDTTEAICLLSYREDGTRGPCKDLQPHPERFVEAGLALVFYGALLARSSATLARRELALQGRLQGLTTRRLTGPPG